MSSRETALGFKATGNAHFKAGRFAEAIVEFSKAIEHDATDHVFFSNRYVCLCMCVSVSMSGCTGGLWVYVCAVMCRLCVCVLYCTFDCLYAYVCVPLLHLPRTHTHTHTYTYTYTYTHAHIHTHIHIHIHIHTRTGLRVKHP
jgi:hypothetical protein